MHGYVENNHASNANGDSWLVSFLSIHSKVEPSILWIFSTMYRHYLQQCRITMKVLAKYFSRQYRTKCRTCSNETNEIVLHTTMYCRGHHDRRHAFWVALHDTVENANFEALIQLPPDLQLVALLSGLPSLVLEDAARVKTAYKIILNYLAHTHASQ